MNHGCDGDIICNWQAWNDPQRLGKERIDHPKYSIVETGQNIGKSPEEMVCHSASSQIPSANAGVKNSKEIIYKEL